jgi:hypothetical protein
MDQSRKRKHVVFFWGMVAGTLLGALSSRSWPASAGATKDADQQPKPSPPELWLRGTPDEKFAQIERHFRGLDQAMAEIGYRYGELLVAGKQRNWEHAQYQTEKIDLSMRLAIERRPKRAKSSQPFLNDELPGVLAAIRKRDGEQLDTALIRLHASCVECHKAENVLYFKDSVERIRDQAK